MLKERAPYILDDESEYKEKRTSRIGLRMKNSESWKEQKEKLLTWSFSSREICFGKVAAS